MASDQDFAQWAALFVNAQSEVPTTPAPPSPTPASPVISTKVTSAANALLHSVDAGGIPAFVTSNLKQIALDNGIEINDHWTPNQIIEAIRAKAA